MAVRQRRRIGVNLPEWSRRAFMSEQTSWGEPTRNRIVVADDDADILDLVVYMLTQAGFDAVGVSDGAAALAAIEADPPRMAILDIMMPGMSGIEVLRKVRASETIADLDVILLTARTRDADVDTGFAAGASDYIIKPFSPRELLKRVNGVMARSA
jgi:two-component system OmpR family response regulator